MPRRKSRSVKSVESMLEEKVKSMKEPIPTKKLKIKPKTKPKAKPKTRTRGATELAAEAKPPSETTELALETKPTTGATELAPETKAPTETTESAPEPKFTTTTTPPVEFEEREEAQAAATDTTVTPPVEFEEREEAQAAATDTTVTPPVEFEEREEAQAVTDADIAAELPRVPPAGSQTNIIEISGAGRTGTLNFLSVDGPSIEIKESTVTAGSDQFGSDSAQIREFHDITIVRNYEPSQVLMDWYMDTVKGEDWRRNVKLILPNRLWILKDCFLTKYEISTLNSTESGVALTETIGICVGLIENI